MAAATHLRVRPPSSLSLDTSAGCSLDPHPSISQEALQQVQDDLKQHLAEGGGAHGTAAVTSITAAGGVVKSGPPQAAGAAAANGGADSAAELNDAEEARRLKALVACRVLDTPPEKRFDSICTLLQSIFQVGPGRRLAEL